MGWIRGTMNRPTWKTTINIKPNHCESKEVDKEMDILMNAPVLFGLKQQGHLPTIGRMLEDGATWEKIGEEIGWCPETAKEHYGWHIEYNRVHETDSKNPALKSGA